MTVHDRRRHRVGTVLLTALLSIVLSLAFASAVGLGLARAEAASGSAAQPIGRAAEVSSDIFGHRAPESLQPYYYRSLLPLIPKSVYPYYHAIVSVQNYLAGVFAFSSIVSCVLIGLVILTRRR